MIEINKIDYQKSEKVKNLYKKVSSWCNRKGNYTIEDNGEAYVVNVVDPADEAELKDLILSAQFEDSTYEEISPTTYLNVMIKL